MIGDKEPKLGLDLQAVDARHEIKIRIYGIKYGIYMTNAVMWAGVWIGCKRLVGQVDA